MSTFQNQSAASGQASEIVSRRLSPEERQLILVEWNRTEREYPRNACVHQLFEGQVTRNPDSVAVLFEGKSLTYGELNAWGNRLAHHLRGAGIGPGALVGLCFERSPAMLAAVVGILKAGAAYVPIDPRQPRERLAFLFGDIGCPLVITQQSQLSRLREIAGPVKLLDIDSIERARGESGNPVSAVTPNDLAYMLYTSGSTGRPKGVEMPHRALVNLLHWQVGLSAMARGNRTLQFANLSFDVSFQEIFSTWLTGGTLVVAGDEVRSNPVDLLEFIAAGKVNRVFLPFVMLEQLAEVARNTVKLPSQLKEVSVAGEQLRIGPAIRQFFGRMPGCRLWNHYGPTESHVVTSFELTGAPSTWPDLPSIGRPVPNCQIYLLDSQLQPVPPGVPGNLHIGGVCLSQGYHNRPELTAERFIANPFDGTSSARLYQTGDLARWRPDGNLEYLGRLDHQVKVRGYRVELGEIEAALGGYPEIAACAVLAENRGDHETSLVAFAVARDRAELAIHPLRRWLADKLPDYMIPGRFVGVPALPLNANGKVDRKALAQLTGKELAAGTAYVAPHSRLEQELAVLWQEVLRREKVGIQDNFFNLGGHSLLAALLVSRIDRHFGKELPLRRIFEHPTIEQLAPQIAAAPPRREGGEAGHAGAHAGAAMASFGQQGMWLLQETVPDPATYNEPVAWRFSGEVNRERVRDSLQVMFERHAILRTALVLTDEGLAQQIAEARDSRLPWEILDLQDLPEGQRREALARNLLAIARRSFDLAQAPLWGVTWIQLAPGDQVLAFNFHHSIVDEWSLRLFFRELEQLYAAAPARPSPAAAPQYTAFAQWQRSFLTDDVLAPHRSYWKEQFRNLPPLDLPLDQPRPRQPSGRGASYPFEISAPVAEALRKLAQTEQTTLFTVMLAAFQVWLYRHTGQNDLVVVTPLTLRDRTDWQSMLGYFLNALPVRATLEGAADFHAALQQVRQTVLEVLGRADLPFENIVELAHQDRGPGHQPLHQIMFVFLEETLNPLRLGAAVAEPLPASTGTSKNDLMLNVQAAGSVWECQIDYATDLFTADSVARMAGHFTKLLEAIVANRQVPIQRLPLMSDAERQQILVEWNRTDRDYPRDQCVHQLFKEQAARSPQAIAVVDGDNSLTYNELDARADRLAQHLCSLGVGPGALVGLYLDRSLEMIVAILGILKAGGAYWALEDKFSEERLGRLFADARALVVLAPASSVSSLESIVQDPRFGPVTGTVIRAIETLLETEPPATAVERPMPRPTDPAYVSYTSGSTGQPKGVVVPHRGVVRLVKGANYVSLTAEETLLHLSPLSFDASTFEIWGALLNGGRLVLLPPGPPTVGQISEAIRRHQVTTLWLTAGLFHLMVDEGLEDLKPLRQLLAGGDVLSPDHVRKAFHALPGCRIVNGYGPTENTTFTCCQVVTGEDDLTPSVLIGSPIANTRVYVLDPALQPVPVGVAGELYAGGDGLASGYHNRPDLTEERFVPDPFSGQAGARLYRTGDLVRWRPGGRLEFLGRADQQVKIRGYRIELGGIEATLDTHPEVSACAVLAEDRGDGDKVLVAFVVGKEPSKLLLESLRPWLADRLPDYMIPARFVGVPALILNANGKLDRKALLALSKSTGDTPNVVVPPINLLELQLTRIWRRLFRREDIGRQDDFFALGGHSLLAARVAAEVDKLFNCKLPIATLFQSPTIESLARQLTDKNWAPPWSSLVPLQPQGSKPPLFFVHGCGGDIYSFVELAKLLPADQPSYGIQAVGLDGKASRHASVEAMAAHYVNEITSFQPTGPILLAGYSMGGLIAYEMALQLERSGRRVALLALLDSAPLNKIPWGLYLLSMASYVPRRCWFHLQRWRKLPRGEFFRYLRGRGRALWTLMVLNTSKPRVVTAPPPPNPDAPQIDGYFDYYHAVAATYNPPRFAGSATVFASEEVDRGWKWWYWKHYICGGVSCVRVPGRHAEILLPPHLSTLATSFATVVERAQRDAVA